MVKSRLVTPALRVLVQMYISFLEQAVDNDIFIPCSMLFLNEKYCVQSRIFTFISLCAEPREV